MIVLTKHRPLKFNFKSQGFGENLACYCNGYVVGKRGDTCNVGCVDFYKSMGMDGHNGHDWNCPVGTPLYHGWNYKGWARYDADFDGGLGIDIVSHEPILTCKEGCPEGTKHYVKHRQWHLSDYTVKNGEDVFQGQQTALSGNTGASSGPHLHEALKWCDEKGKGIHQDNGYRGAIGEHVEIQRIEDVFILDFLNIKETKNVWALGYDMWVTLWLWLRHFS